jgi:hypothetical protein
LTTRRRPVIVRCLRRSCVRPERQEHLNVTRAGCPP